MLIRHPAVNKKKPDQVCSIYLEGKVIITLIQTKHIKIITLNNIIQYYDLNNKFLSCRYISYSMCNPRTF